MRRSISILLMFLMLLQAIPVLHFFSSHKAIFYTYVDEEKPEQKSKAGKDDYNKDVYQATCLFPDEETAPLFLPFVEKQHNSPYLEFTTPPPDAC